MLHITPTNLLLLAAKQEPYKKVYFSTKNIEEFSGKSSREWTTRQKKKRKKKEDKTERVKGLGRRTGEIPVGRYSCNKNIYTYFSGRDNPGSQPKMTTKCKLRPVSYQRLGPHGEDLCHAGEEFLCLSCWAFQPVGAVQINILDQQWVVRIDVTHQDGKFLHRQSYRK